jgi:hypothetical protein
MVDHYASRFALQPTEFTDTADALAMLQESGGYPAATTLRQDVERGFDRLRVREIPSAEAMKEWLTLYAESPLYASTAERVLHRFIGQCKTTKELVDVLYQLALGGFSSSNPAVVRRAMEIMSFQTPVVRPESPQGMLHIFSMFDRDDEILKKAMEIDGTFFYIATQRAPELLEQASEAHNIILEQPEYTQNQAALVAGDQRRFERIAQHYQRPTTSGGMLEHRAGEQAEAFPLNLITRDIGPLRRLLNEFMAQDIQQRHGQGITAALDLPGSTGVTHANTLSELGAIVKARLGENALGPQRMETPSHIRTLSYLLPPEVDGFTEWSRIADANQRLRAEMTADSRYLLSPRGDLVEIVDDTLRDLGFQSIAYQMDSRNRRETVVTLTVGADCQYRVLLDEHFALCQVESRSGIPLPQHGAFLENTILSHLREIRCSDAVNEMNPTIVKHAGTTRRAFTSRRAHRRVLPEGHSPTPDQIIRILDEYDVDLVRMNREREATGEQRRVTYVYEVEDVALGGNGPVRSRTPQATRELHTLLVPPVQPESDQGPVV